MASTVVVERFTTGSTTGNVDFTTPKLNGLTPKAALIMAIDANTNDSENGDWNLSLGATDGTRQWYQTQWRQDGQGTSQTREQDNITDCVVLRSPSDAVRGAFNSWLTNGIRINFSILARSVYLHIIFFAGDEVSAYADDEQFPANADLDVTSPGFQPSIVFGVWRNSTSLGFSQNGVPSWGWSIDTATNSVANRSLNSQATTDVQCKRADNRTLSDVVNNTRDVVFESFDSQGFTAGKRGPFDVRNFRFFYLALAFSDAQVWAGALDSPTTTGSVSYTGPGFEPQFVAMSMGMIQTENTTITGTDSQAIAQTFMDSTDEYCAAVRDEDDVTTTNSGQISTNKAIKFNDPSGTLAFEADLTSFDSLGWTLNYSTADGTVRKWGAFAIEATGAPPAPGGKYRPLLLHGVG